MSNIITVSREFGSGGRELGRRAAYRALFTEDRWGSKESYHLCINTSGIEIKHLIPVIAAYAKVWFEEKKADE